jgi:hypothetical protein
LQTEREGDKDTLSAERHGDWAIFDHDAEAAQQPKLDVRSGDPAIVVSVIHTSPTE